MKMNISPNASDSEDEGLSNEELSRKIQSFRNLCMENKINTSNAFDLNMVGYFYKWLTKKKHEIDCDVALFHELADYLDTTGKIYCCRVDNADENLNKLIHEVRNTHYKNGTMQSVNNDEVKMLKREKPIKTKLMLTTADKLSNKSLGVCLNYVNSKFTFQELFKTGRPANYISSMYYDIPLETELMQIEENKVENKNNNKYKMKNITNEISKSVICPEFFEFVAEQDKKSNYNIENSELENIEDYFHCEIEPCQAFKMKYNSTESEAADECYNELINNEKSINDDSNLIATNDKLINNNEFGTVNDNCSLLFDQLVDCVDYEQRDYSYFNPKLLAHWSGPTAWKATAMMKALKSYNPNKQQNIQISTPGIDDDNKENTDNNKGTHKKRANKCENVKEIKWLNMKEIEPLLEKMVVGKEQIQPHVLAKWHPLNNRADPPPFQIFFKYPHLNYIVSQPNCIKSHINKIKEPCRESTKYTPNCQITDDLSHTVLVDNSYNFNNSDINKSQKDNFENENIDDSILEANMDISELKNKIMKILNRKCVEFQDNCEWSNNLAFSDLLTQLNVSIENDELSVGLIYVGLLHLTNEIGLKVVQGYNSVTNLEDIYIAKPANK